MKNPYYICDRLILTFKIHFMNKILRYSLIMVLGLFSTISFAQTETLDLQLRDMQMHKKSHH